MRHHVYIQIAQTAHNPSLEPNHHCHTLTHNTPIQLCMPNIIFKINKHKYPKHNQPICIHEAENSCLYVKPNPAISQQVIHNNTHALYPHVLQQAAICLWKTV